MNLDDENLIDRKTKLSKNYGMDDKEIYRLEEDSFILALHRLVEKLAPIVKKTEANLADCENISKRIEIFLNEKIKNIDDRSSKF